MANGQTLKARDILVAQVIPQEWLDKEMDLKECLVQEAREMISLEIEASRKDFNMGKLLEEMAEADFTSFGANIN